MEKILILLGMILFIIIYISFNLIKGLEKDMEGY